MVERHCRADCPGETPRRLMMGRTLGDDTELVNPTKRGPRPIKTMEERNQEKEEMRAKATQDHAYYEQEVNEQTLRMMHAHISPLLLNITGPQVVTKEYQFFQQIRQVVEKACPDEFVPKGLLKGLMRMFRQLLWETQDVYFQHQQSNNEDQFNHTMIKLGECAEKTPDPSLLFGTYTDAFDPTEQPETPDDPTMAPPGPERCPEPLMYGINGTDYNSTDISENNKWLRNISGEFLPHLKFNSSQVDIVIETAWKIAMIGHDRCSKYFDDQTAIEFSTFFHQVQSFFNPRIIKRWYYESSVKATFDIVRLIFPSYNLRKFMFGLDACLLGTHSNSHFPYMNAWIQRPKIPMTDNDLSQKKHVLPGATSRLSTLDYAPDRPAKKEEKTRRKRDLGKYNLWSQTARCIEDYMDPIRKPGEYQYRLPSGCIPPVNLS